MKEERSGARNTERLAESPFTRTELSDQPLGPWTESAFLGAVAVMLIYVHVHGLFIPTMSTPGQQCYLSCPM